jgi:hypothetical protein
MSDREATVDHLYKLFYDTLGMCGCGNPEEAYALIRDILALAPFYEESRWQLVERLTGGGAANHIVLSTLDHAGLIEHGSSLSGAWLTEKGAWCLSAMWDVMFDEVSEYGGYPHDGGDCTDECWKLPADAPTA